MQEVTNNDTEIVAALRRALAIKVGSERFAVWFGRGVRMETHGKTLRIAAADTRLQFLRRNFQAELAETASGAGLEVEFIVDPSVAVDIAPRDAQAAVDAIKPAGQARRSEPATIPLRHHLGTKRYHGTTEQAAGRREARHEFASLAEFLPGAANVVALTAAQTAATRPGTYNPLAFAGAPGSGKTHLLEGIWRQARTGGTMSRVTYLTAEQFTNSFLEAIRHSGMPSFRAKVRETELLLIDDIDFLIGKQSTLVEAVNTIDCLVRSGRQIVVSVDRPLADLKARSPELAARLAAGLVCQLEPADFGVRQGILRRLAAKQGMVIADDVIDWIAGQFGGDARELSGALSTLKIESEARMRDIDLSLAQEKLAERILASRPTVRLPDILDAVCDCLGIESGALQSTSKASHVTTPRMLVMFLARKWTRAALSEISRSVGRKSHSTVLSAEQKVTQWLAAGKTIELSRGQWRVEDAIKRIEGQLRLA
jgi:chromosomal replication initiator protein